MFTFTMGNLLFSNNELYKCCPESALRSIDSFKLDCLSVKRAKDCKLWCAALSRKMVYWLLVNQVRAFARRIYNPLLSIFFWIQKARVALFLNCTQWWIRTAGSNNPFHHGVQAGDRTKKLAQTTFTKERCIITTFWVALGCFKMCYHPHCKNVTGFSDYEGEVAFTQHLPEDAGHVL